MSKLENKIQADLVVELKEMFPGCMVLMNDANYIQGIPDLLLLWGEKWAALEVKESYWARQQPNQGYYVDKMDGMSYAAFIYPENKEAILHELKQTLSSRR